MRAKIAKKGRNYPIIAHHAPLIFPTTLLVPFVHIPLSTIGSKRVREIKRERKKKAKAKLKTEQGEAKKILNTCSILHSTALFLFITLLHYPSL
jgi:hypothetical protein